MKINILFFLLIILSIPCVGQGALAGPSSGCVGSTSYVVDSGSSVPGTWSSSDTAVAAIDPVYGTIYCLSAGVTTITFTPSTGSYLTRTFTVDTPLLAISETSTNFCAGSTSICTDASPGGSWSVDAGYAFVSSAGVVTGLSSGVVDIYYTVGGCSVFVTDTINTPSPGSFVVPPVTCVGSVTTIEDSTVGASGGTWSISNLSIASVDGAGNVTGLSPGTDTITYTISDACGTASTSVSITISGTTIPGTISASAISVGATATVTDYGASAPGTWSSSDPTIASIDSVSGIITGITTGTITITYSVDGCGGISTASATDTVSLLDGISGHLFLDSSMFVGEVKVWLITYNPGTLDLEAVDSTIITMAYGDSEGYFQFIGLSTDSFRIKAALVGDTGSMSYVPTYHTSSIYWSSASVLYHIAGSADMDQDIHMVPGLYSSGPGFIAGSVTTGAGRGTSASIPVPELLVFAMNAVTNTLVQHTYTDSSGRFSFSDLPLGNYFIYPENINYNTIPYDGISVTSSSTSFNSAYFTENTSDKTITPHYEQATLFPFAKNISIFPDPVSENVYVGWQMAGGANGIIYITDISGRELLITSVDMSQANGSTGLDLSGFKTGVYILTIKSSGANYISKIQVQH